MQNLIRGGLPPRDNNSPPSQGWARGGASANSATTAFTLVELLVAMSLTLLMMAAVISVFASVSDSTGNRRATMEMSGRLRQARTLLQDDLANLTCPALPDTRPEGGQGYLEIVEGPMCDFDPSIWLRDENNDGVPDQIGTSGNELWLDLSTSQLPSSNLFRLPGSTEDVRNPSSPPSYYTTAGVTDGGGLGDWDDVLMLTVRNDIQPFVGRVPTNYSQNDGTPIAFNLWGSQALESQLAEVVWFAVENPVEENKSFYFGEPGFRTVYRRALLIAPWLDFGYVINGVKTGPGVVRVLGNSVGPNAYDLAAAALIAFQEEYDLSVRIVWDPLLGNDGRWVIKANTLADLTKREHRLDHRHVENVSGNLVTTFPYPLIASGDGTTATLLFHADQEARGNIGDDSVIPVSNTGADGDVASSRLDAMVYAVRDRGKYAYRPAVRLTHPSAASEPTVRAIVSEVGEVVMFTNGMVPLSGARRGEDVVLSNMLAFDIKVFDPQAPMLATDFTTDGYPGEVIGPDSPAWGPLAFDQFRNNATPNANAIVSRGAYVDLGYLGSHAYYGNRNNGLSDWDRPIHQDLLLGNSVFAFTMNPQSQLAGATIVTGGYEFAPYRTYDTWSFSYENNGLDEDNDGLVDEATNGIDDNDQYGVDDPSEREAPPPYDVPLRGVQITLRAYELDSRSIREVNVKQSFVPK